MDKTALLRRSYLFGDADDESLGSLAAAATPRKMEPGRIVFMEGDPGDALFVIASGLVKIYVSSAEEGKELTLAFLEDGDVFGEIALLDGRARTAGAMAVEETLALELSRKSFFDAVRKLPNFAEHMFEMVCERFRNTLNDLNGFAFESLRRRLAVKLLSLAVAHGQFDGDRVIFRRRFSQNELAQLLGVTREAVNRHLGEWSKAGVLSMTRGRLEIHDISKIRSETGTG